MHVSTFLVNADVTRRMVVGGNGAVSAKSPHLNVKFESGYLSRTMRKTSYVIHSKYEHILYVQINGIRHVLLGFQLVLVRNE